MDSTSHRSDRSWSLLIAAIGVLASIGAAYITVVWTSEEQTQKELDQGQVVLNNIVFRYSMSLSELVKNKDKGSVFHNKTAEYVYLENLKQIRRDIQWLYENQISISINDSIARLMFTEMIIAKEIYNLENDPSRNRPDPEVLKSVCKLLDKGILTLSAGDEDTLTVTTNVEKFCEANP